MKTALALLFALPGVALADPVSAPSTLIGPAVGSVRAATPVMEVQTTPPVYTGVPRVKEMNVTRPEPAAQQDIGARPVDKAKLPVGMLPVDRQLELLRRQVDDLQQRLAQAEKRFAEHRHEYSTTNLNAINYRTLKSLLDNADRRDGLLHFSSMPVARDTSPPRQP